MDLDAAWRAFGTGEVDDADELGVLQPWVAIGGDVVAGVESSVGNTDRADEGIEERPAIGETVERPPLGVFESAGDDEQFVVERASGAAVAVDVRVAVVLLLRGLAVAQLEVQLLALLGE